MFYSFLALKTHISYIISWWHIAVLKSVFQCFLLNMWCYRRVKVRPHDRTKFDGQNRYHIRGEAGWRHKRWNDGSGSGNKQWYQMRLFTIPFQLCSQGRDRWTMFEGDVRWQLRHLSQCVALDDWCSTSLPWFFFSTSEAVTNNPLLLSPAVISLMAATRLFLSLYTSALTFHKHGFCRYSSISSRVSFLSQWQLFSLTEVLLAMLTGQLRTNELTDFENPVTKWLCSSCAWQYRIIPHQTVSDVSMLRTRTMSGTPLGARFWRHQRAFPLSTGSW